MACCYGFGYHLDQLWLAVMVLDQVRASLLLYCRVGKKIPEVPKQKSPFQIKQETDAEISCLQQN